MATHSAGRRAPHRGPARADEPTSRSSRDPSSAPLARLFALDEGTLRAWSLLVTCSAVIFFLNTRPDFRISSRSILQYWMAQTGHLIGHMALGALAWQAFTRSFGHRRGYWLAFCVAGLHSVIDEWVQVYVPTRDANLEDVFTNLAGVGLGIAVMEFVRWRAGRAALRRYRRAGAVPAEQPPARGAGVRRAARRPGSGRHGPGRVPRTRE